MDEEYEWKEQKSAEFWSPSKIGEEISGAVIQIEEGDYGKIYLISVNEHTQIRTPSHKVLQSRMSKIKVGDVVKILYEGQEAPTIKGHNKTEMYKVFKRQDKKVTAENV